MIKRSDRDITFVGGVGDPLADPDSEIVKRIMSGAAWGATFGVYGELPGMGAVAGIMQKSFKGLYHKCQ